MADDNHHIIKLAEQVGQATSAVQGLSKRFDEDLVERKEIRKAQEDRFTGIEATLKDLTQIANRAVVGARIVRYALLLAAGIGGAWAAGGEWVSKALSFTHTPPPR